MTDDEPKRGRAREPPADDAPKVEAIPKSRGLKAPSREALPEAMKVIEKALLNPEKFPKSFYALPLDDPGRISAVLTPARIEMLRVLRDEGPFDSVGALAARLKRDQGSVSRDLGLLVSMGLAKSERNGTEKKVSATDRTIILV